MKSFVSLFVSSKVHRQFKVGKVVKKNVIVKLMNGRGPITVDWNGRQVEQSCEICGYYKWGELLERGDYRKTTLMRDERSKG